MSSHDKMMGYDHPKSKAFSPPRGSNSQPSDDAYESKSLTLYPIELGGQREYIYYIKYKCVLKSSASKPVGSATGSGVLPERLFFSYR
jgi:hypothetical protein